jgi:hypothetical protein
MTILSSLIIPKQLIESDHFVHGKDFEVGETYVLWGTGENQWLYTTPTILQLDNVVTRLEFKVIVTCVSKPEVVMDWLDTRKTWATKVITESLEVGWLLKLVLFDQNNPVWVKITPENIDYITEIRNRIKQGYWE